jgi:hypothetical protein
MTVRRGYDSRMAAPTPFACDMTAIPAEERGAHHALIRRLMSEVSEVRELPDGLAFRFPADAYDAVARFVARERLCCPFLHFALDVAPERGLLWLRLTGAEGVKAFIRAELRLPDA